METWYNELQKKCHALKIEYITDGEDKNKLTFFCAKIPTEKEKKEIIALIPPSVATDFIEGPKNVTLHSIQIYLIQARIFPCRIETFNHKLVLTANVITEVSNDHPFWAAMNDILEKDGYFHEWEINLNNEKHSFSFKISKDIQKNKVRRDHGITQEEITDLHILLNDPNMTWNKLMKIL